MENGQQLTRYGRAPILKSMPEATEISVNKGQESSVDERPQEENDTKNKRKNWREELTPEEKARQKLRLAENEAKKALEAADRNLKAEKRRPVEDLSTEELISEYDRWVHLQDKLTKSKNAELTRALDTQIKQVEAELLVRGVKADLPSHELSGLADMPVSYSADLINNLTKAALGIDVAADSADNVFSDGTTIHVPNRVLTLEDTVRIAEEIAKTNPELLKEKSGKILEMGGNIRDLAQYLAGQTIDGGESIFKTEEQRMAIVSLYNAGVWLEKIANKQATIERIEDWHTLRKDGKNFVKRLQATGQEGAMQQAKILEFFFGKSLAKGRVPTTYQRLLEKHGQTEEALRNFLSGPNGQRLVRHLAPFIAESFASGKAARNIARGASQIEQLTPQVIFDEAKAKTHDIQLPAHVVARIKELYPNLSLNTDNLVQAAKNLYEKQLKNLPVERQLAALNDMIRFFQLPGEIKGKVAEGYQLGKVFANETAELGCSVRTFLLARVIEEVYQGENPEKQPHVAENTLLLPTEDGRVIGHTRLQITFSSSETVYTIDPSVMTFFGTGVVSNRNEQLAETIRKVSKTGTSEQVEDKNAHHTLSKFQTLGNSNQRSNLLVNIAATTSGEDQKRMLQMALQDNNQIALLHLIKISKSDERDLYVSRLQKLNPAIDSETLEKMLQTSEENFIVKATIQATTGVPAIDIIISNFINGAAVNIPRGSGLTPGVDMGSYIDAETLQRFEQAITQNLSGVTSAVQQAAVQTVLVDLQSEIQRAETIAHKPEGEWEYVQNTLQYLERDGSTPTGFAQLEGNYSIAQGLRDHVNKLNPRALLSPVGTPPGKFVFATLDEARDFINQLRAELHVRTAGHDISYLGRLKGESGVQQMVEGANRFTTDEYLEVESLPGVAFVRRLFEQETGHFLAERGGIGPNDFDEITQRVNRRFEELRQNGVVGTLPTGMTATLSKQEQQEIDRARTVGKNLFILKTRIAHFISYGDPGVTGGQLGIGNAPWDFLTRIYSPYNWMIGRYGTVPEHAEPILELIGKDKINRLLYLQDHDSSIWRIPTFLAEFDALHMDKQALFMRLYWTGEGYHEKELLKTQTKEQLRADRLSLVNDILKYVPEELVSVFRDEQTIKNILQNPHYEQFLTDIISAREECIAAGDFTYSNFDANLGRNANSVAIYNDLRTFLSRYRGDLATPNHEFHFQGGREIINPLFGQRILSLADAPFEYIDKIVDLDTNGNPVIINGVVQMKINENLSNKLGGQDVGREWNSVSDASKAMGAVAKYLAHPSLEHLKELVGLFSGYKSWTWDENVRDELFKGYIKYIQEDKHLRLLLPGVDRFLAGGKGSIAQRNLGKRAESLDTLELRGLIQEAKSEGLISHEAAEDLIKMVDTLKLFSAFPLIQVILSITIVSLIRTALNPKALVAA